MTTWQLFINSVLLYLPRLGTSLAIGVAFWIAGIASQRVVERMAARRLEPDLTRFIGLGVKCILLALGAITALGTLGIDVTALVAGLGLTGLAVGFALKDIISNALSGILILIYKPFKRHDDITVTSFQGTVAEINLRYTILEAPGHWTFVPNSILITNAIMVRTKAEPVELKT